MKTAKIHIISNSHLDPVWLWNRSSGRCTWLNTMHSVIRMMRRHDDLTFTASSSAMYRWIEETDPGLFCNIKSLVKEGRWELTGGWEVQSDTIISRPEMLLRQAEHGKRYFQDRFGVDVRTAYSVDSFGHSGGLPKILSASGFDNYVFMRCHSDVPWLFNWIADDGSRVTASRISGSYTTSIKLKKEDFFERIEKLLDCEPEEQTLFFGIGDHGGGIYEKHYEYLREAAGIYPIEFSTLTEYFRRMENAQKHDYKGELGPVFRGCYSSCHGIKNKIAVASERILKAERLTTEYDTLTECWQELLFAHFHDSLPGTSIKEAYTRDIIPCLGMVEHKSNYIIDKEMAKLASVEDSGFMTQGGVQVWNPHEFGITGIVAVDAFTDPNNTGIHFNALVDKSGNRYPMQITPPASGFGPCGYPWGRLTATISLNGGEIKYLAYGYSNENATPTGFLRQHEFIKKLGFSVSGDNSRTWGFGLEKFDKVKAYMELRQTKELFDGPVCSRVSAEYVYGDSKLQLDITAYKELPELKLELRLDWHDIECCLKLEMSHHYPEPVFVRNGCGCIHKQKIEDYGMFEWKNSQLSPFKQNSGELSFIDWCAVSGDGETTGFYSPDLHACDFSGNKLRITLLRPTLYADHQPFEARKDDGYQDLGYTFLQLWNFSTMREISTIPRYAQARLIEAETREVTCHDGSNTSSHSSEDSGFPDSVVVISSRRYPSRRLRELHLVNYGKNETILLPSGKQISLPENSIKIIYDELT